MDMENEKIKQFLQWYWEDIHADAKKAYANRDVWYFVHIQTLEDHIIALEKKVENLLQMQKEIQDKLNTWR